MTQSTFNKILTPVFLIFLLIIGSVWIGNTIYGSTHPELNKKEITFNVVGIVNATNSSIINIQFECIKYCIDEVTSSYSQQEKCWDECAKLGNNQE